MEIVVVEILYVTEGTVHITGLGWHTTWGCPLLSSLKQRGAIYVLVPCWISHISKKNVLLLSPSSPAETLHLEINISIFSYSFQVLFHIVLAVPDNWHCGVCAWAVTETWPHPQPGHYHTLGISEFHWHCNKFTLLKNQMQQECIHAQTIHSLLDFNQILNYLNGNSPV